MHSLNTFGTWTNHGHTRTYKIHYGPNLGEATTFPPIIFFVISHKGLHPNVIFSWDSQVGSLEIFEIGIPAILEAHNILCKPPIEARYEAKL
jgi:hypothetical protein